MNDILLEKNLFYLYKKHPDMLSKVQEYLDETKEKSIELVSDSNNQFNLSLATANGNTLLYDYNSLNEWQRSYDYLKHRDYDVILYGLGLSHHLVKLIELNQNLSFFILEPDLNIFIESMKVVDIELLLTHPQIKFFHIGNTPTDLDIFHYHVITYSTNAKEDVFVPFYAQLDMESVRRFYDREYVYRENQLIMFSFEKMFGTLPYRNSIRNISKLLRSPSIQELKDQFNRCTALIIGAGPSLEKDIENIIKYKDRFLVIAAGSSIQSLLHYDLVPDLIVSMDPGEANGRAFQNSAIKDIPLLFIPQIYSEILEKHPNNNMHALFKNDCIIEYLFNDLQVDYKFLANNSVSGTAVQVARYVGATKIVFAGQDLSYPNEQYYASGANHFSREFLDERVKNGNLEVENVNGTKNPTSIAMISTLENIEKLITTLNDVEFVNTSSLGAKINGANYLPFLEVATSIDNNYDFSVIKEYVQSFENKTDFSFENVESILNDAIEVCELIIDRSKLCLKHVSEIERLCRTKPDKSMKKLSDLENDFSIVTEHLFYKKIITTWMRILTSKYDQNVIKIAQEPTIVGKSRLLNKIVAPYITAIIESSNDIKNEFLNLKNKLGTNH